MRGAVNHTRPNYLEQFRLAWILLTILGMTSAACAEPELGKPIEAFRITTLNGDQITPASQRGRVLVVNLWATWCLPCREEMPAIEAFFARYRQSGVDVIAISLDDRSEVMSVRKVMTSYSFPAALATDSDLSAFGRVRQVPATFIIDREGILRRNGWREVGVVDVLTLEKAVQPLLDQRAK